MPRCPTCKYLKDDLKPQHSDFYVRCSWPDFNAVPMKVRWGIGEVGWWLTKKTVITEGGARLDDCAAYQPIEGQSG